jgi:hypothetical protein
MGHSSVSEEGGREGGVVGNGEGGGGEGVREEETRNMDHLEPPLR